MRMSQTQTLQCNRGYTKLRAWHLMMGVILALFSFSTTQADLITRTYGLASYPTDQAGATLSGEISVSFESTAGPGGGVLDLGGGSYLLLPAANPITSWNFMVSKSGHPSYAVNSTDSGADLSSSNLTLTSTGTTLSLDSSSRLELGISGVNTLLTWNRTSGPEIYFSGFEGDVSPGWSTSAPASIVEDSGGSWIIAAIPEPSSVLLLLTAMAGLFILRPYRNSEKTA